MEFDKHNELHNQINVSTLTLVVSVGGSLWCAGSLGHTTWRTGCLQRWEVELYGPWSELENI